MVEEHQLEFAKGVVQSVFNEIEKNERADVSLLNFLCNFIFLQLKFSNSVPKAIPRNDNGRGEEAGDRCIH